MAKAATLTLGIPITNMLSFFLNQHHKRSHSKNLSLLRKYSTLTKIQHNIKRFATNIPSLGIT